MIGLTLGIICNMNMFPTGIAHKSNSGNGGIIGIVLVG
ncbi:hypothetical protein SBF1_3870003 [Candidatus Desulfosporosinus infrequens]|uniref:Uncharacterized protein n=1 Tax=Candidatus Desulfosporosinus infrequens TaxID=2043169 RepID=A0A2U3L694_9FIRM|nr:hypothetical protein SBF1_3870003 [Candidatus Desulfosporosinus infrequens]